MKYESVDRSVKVDNVNLDDAFTLANMGMSEGFKLYDDNGCFLKEFRLFDGKYREVNNAI